jgi:hypothetical protein
MKDWTRLHNNSPRYRWLHCMTANDDTISAQTPMIRTKTCTSQITSFWIMDVIYAFPGDARPLSSTVPRLSPGSFPALPATAGACTTV